MNRSIGTQSKASNQLTLGTVILQRIDGSDLGETSGSCYLNKSADFLVLKIHLCNKSKLNMTPHDECNKPHVDEGGVISRLQSLEGHKMSL